MQFKWGGGVANTQSTHCILKAQLVEGGVAEVVTNQRQTQETGTYFITVTDVHYTLADGASYKYGELVCGQVLSICVYDFNPSQVVLRGGFCLTQLGSERNVLLLQNNSSQCT